MVDLGIRAIRSWRKHIFANRSETEGIREVKKSGDGSTKSDEKFTCGKGVKRKPKGQN